MASAFTHAFAAAGLAAAVLPGSRLPRLATVGVLCSLLPDVDVVGFRLGVDYGHLLGHRGLSHSLAFALLVAVVLTPALFRGPDWRGLHGRVAVFLFVATASHGLFDATTNGGLGVAFFSPFDATRYFLPWRPVEVSPIGVAAFFDRRALVVLRGEALWIGVPWIALCLAVAGARRRIDRGRGAVRESTP